MESTNSSSLSRSESVSMRGFLLRRVWSMSMVAGWRRWGREGARCGRVPVTGEKKGERRRGRGDGGRSS